MFHFHSKKGKKRLSVIIIIFLSIAMVLPTLAYFVK